MKKLCLVLALVVLAGSISTAQVKAVHFKKLQEFLPAKEIKNFKRLKPSGTTQTNMGMSTSEAAVRYESTQVDTVTTSEGTVVAPPKSIEIKISDMLSMPYAAMAFQMQPESESETEESSQKTLMIKGKYKGQEEIQKGENNKSCKISFGVANRYIVNLELNGVDDAKILYDILDMINLDGLEKLTTETK
jgi:hypothetical protein